MDRARSYEQLVSLSGGVNIIPHAFPFHGHKQKAEGVVDSSCLSQWYPCVFIFNGIQYNCAEQFMMACKANFFGDHASLKLILASSDPNEQKKIGRRVTPFDVEKWNHYGQMYVILGNLCKFTQNEPLQRFLLSTMPSVLIEASPRDTIWGVGRGADNARDLSLWRGKNLLGFALMEVRQRIIDFPHVYYA